ncbi:unnamed protein product [Moneuplotes crassus]|uniref:N-acetyltransferase domain-containing protein n=1 Tax=Euplotes crassus TaxID=5936 RepID=A0AAD1Y0H0_EUPCR|nr:unnamed protein product [Moneuplotes crassus]
MDNHSSKPDTEEAEESASLEKVQDIDIIFGRPEHSEILATMTAKMALETENITCNIKSITEAVHRFLSNESDSHNEKPYGFYLVAVTNDQTPVGCMMVTYEINPTVGGLIYMLDDVFVEKDFRRMGIFRKIFRKAQEIANEDPHCKGLRLCVEEDNTVAQKVYQNMGMKEVEYKYMQRSFVSFQYDGFL